MLDGLLQALVWLHYGFKKTFPFDRYMGHDKDWQPILAKTIHPYYSMFVTALHVGRRC